MTPIARLWAAPRALAAKYQYETSTALAVAVVTAVFSRGDTALWAYEFQAGLLLCVLAGIVHHFWPRRGLYWDLLLTNPLIGLGIVLLVGLCFGVFFPSFGFYYLFWARSWKQPMISSFALVMTVALHWLLLYFLYIDSYDASLDAAPDGAGRDDGAAGAGTAGRRQRPRSLAAIGHGPVGHTAPESDAASDGPGGDVAPDGDAPGVPGTVRTLSRFEQSCLHSRRLGRALGYPDDQEGRQAGRFVFESTKPFAVLLAIPAVLPRFAVVRIVGDTPWSRLQDYLTVCLSWVAGLGLGLACVYLSGYWITSAARLDWGLRERQQRGATPDREGVATLLRVNAIFAVIAPLLVGLAVVHYAAAWHRGIPLTATVVLSSALFLRAYRLRHTAGSPVAEMTTSLYNDYLITLLGLLVALAVTALLMAGSHTSFTSTVCICYLLTLLSVVVALFDWLFTSQSHRRQMMSVAVVVVLLLLNGVNAYKLQFPGLRQYYPENVLGLARLGDLGPVALEEYQRDEDARFTDEVARRGSKAPLLDDRATLEAWARRHRAADAGRPTTGPARKPKLVVVACSGGALRAAIWTALVLGKIEEGVPEFPRSLRLITGASGGMLGAAYYVCALSPEPGPAPGDCHWLRLQTADGRRLTGEALARQLHQDFWTPSVQQLVFGDLLSLPFPTVQEGDRGKTLERTWLEKEELRNLGLSFSNLADAERCGARPSLVFSPMIVEDSRRLLISNLDLADYTINHGRYDPIRRSEVHRPFVAVLGLPKAQRTGDWDRVFPSYSRTGYQLFRLFPESHKTFRVSTAVRMSATFPLISPAVSLPTAPPLRVVDAGYYDNYGIDLVTTWLEGNREWLAHHTSGVALIQVRAFTNEDVLRNFPAPEATELVSDLVLGVLGGWTGRSGQFLTSPIAGVAKAREMVMAYRNDNAVEGLKRRFTFDRLEHLTGLHDVDPDWLTSDERRALAGRYEEARDFFRVFTFTCGRVTPSKEVQPARLQPEVGQVGSPLPEGETMNWFVPDSEFNLILRPIWDGNKDMYKQVVDWFHAHPQP